jgi:uncharacterized protein (DUF58 family)
VTGSWRLVAAVSVIFVFSGFLLSNGPLVVIALPILAFALVPFVVPFPTASAKVDVEVGRAIVPEGEWTDVTASVSNTGPGFPLAVVSLCLPQGTRVDGEARLAGPLESLAVRSVSLRLAASRGKYDLTAVRLEVFDALGLRRRETLLSASASFFVMPSMEHLESVEILPSKTRALPGSIRSRLTGSGVEFFGTREYSPGDPLRQLNWRAGERWDQLVTNVFNEEKAADVGIVLDARSVCEVNVRGESLFEHSVRAAASFADYFLRNGNRVGLLNYGSFVDWIFPGYGKIQRMRVLSALSRAKPGDHAAFREFSYLPIRLFPPRAQLVFISPLLADDVSALRYLRALKFEVLVVSPDPVSFEAQREQLDEYGVLAQRILSAERVALLTRLRRSGTRVIEWDTSIPLGVTLRRFGRGGER